MSSYQSRHFAVAGKKTEVQRNPLRSAIGLASAVEYLEGNIKDQW